MAIYFTEETNTLDPKGRVCLPSQFRQQLPESKRDCMFAYTDVKEPRLLLFDQEFMERLLDIMHSENVAMYPEARIETTEEAEKWDHLRQEVAQKNEEDYSAISNGFLTRIAQLKIDDTGRLLFPQRLLDHARLKRSVTFCGLGRAIGVYDPEYFHQHIASATAEQKRARAVVSRLVGGLP